MSITTPNDLQLVMGSTQKTRPVNQPITGLILALGTDGSYYSEDGETFIRSNLTTLASDFIVIANNKKIVLAMTADFQVYRSTDGGITWTAINADATNGNGGSWDVSLRDLTHQLIYMKKFNAFVFTNNAGFGKSFDNGATWQFELWTTNHTTAFQNFWYLDDSPSLEILAGVGGANQQNIWTEDLTTWNLTAAANASRNPQYGQCLWVKELTKFVSYAYDTSVTRIVGQQSFDGKSWSSLFDLSGGGGLNCVAFGPGLGPNIGRFIIPQTNLYRISDDGGFSIVTGQFISAGGGNKFSIIWSKIHRGFYTYDADQVYFSPNGANLNWIQISTQTPPARINLKQLLEVI